MKLSAINNSSQLLPGRTGVSPQLLARPKRIKWKQKDQHAMFIFNGFLLLQMPQCTWSARRDGNKRDRRRRMEDWKGWRAEKQLSTSTHVLFSFCYRLFFLKRWGVGGVEKKMLRPPSCGISRLIRTTSCSAAGLSGLCWRVCTCACVPACVCGQKSKSVPGQQSVLKTQRLIL